MKHNLYKHHFQPIVNMSNQHINGFEGLLRVKDLTSPQALIEKAIHTDRLFEFDMMSIEKLIQTFVADYTNETADVDLFINVFPSTITSPFFYERFKQLLTMYPISPENIVLELNELEAITHYDLLREAMAQFRQIKVKFALDDFGEGMDSLKKAIELEPEYVKLDKYFAKNLSISERKQQLLRIILQYFSAYNIATIIEGIENEADLFTAQSLGIQLGQGYLFGRPSKLACFLNEMEVD